MIARDVMTAELSVVTPSDPIARAAEIMRDLDIGAVPVVDDAASMRLRGILTDRDIAIRCVAKKHGVSCRVGDHMTTHVETVKPDADLSRVIWLMEQKQIRRVPVVSIDDRLQGIIAQADLATKVGPKDPLVVEEVLERVSSEHVPQGAS